MRPGRVVIAAGALAFCGYVLYALLNLEPVRVSASRLEHHGDAVCVAGSLANSGPDAGPLDLEVRYYDAGGRTIAKDTIVVQQLAKGARTGFRSPERRLSGVADFSIYLNHGKNPYGN